MAYICSISIDDTNVTDYLLQHTKLIKIIRSDKILIDHLFLIINKEHYKGPLPKEGSVMKFSTMQPARAPITIALFYIYKDDNASNRGHLTEAEKALAKDPNNIVFHGLSVKPAFIQFYEEAINIMTSPPAHVFKNKTLKEVLEYMQQALDIDELIINHQYLDTNITYLKVNKIQLKQDGSYYKTIMEELADIFYATSSIRDNKLYFLQKRYSGDKQLLKSELSLSNSNVIDISNIEGQYDNNPPYTGVSFHYFEGKETNIKQTSLKDQPFLNLDNVYEKSLAYRYATSKLAEIAEPEILKLTLIDIQSKLPGYYLIIKKSKGKVQQPLEKRVNDIIGGYSVKSCIITYNPYGHTHQDPNKAGPSAKKPKLEPLWSTTLHLIKMSGGLNS